MTAFLYIAAENGSRRPARRVDLANIGDLFVDSDVPRERRWRRTLQIVAAVLVWVIAIGEMILVTQPNTVASCAAIGQQAPTGLGRSM